MRKHWLKQTAAIMIISIMTTGIGSTFFPASFSTVAAATQSTTTETVDFSEMTYEHFDTTEFYSTIKSIRKLMTKSKNSSKVLKKFESLYEALNEIQEEAEMATLYTYMDVSSEYYTTEYSYCYNTAIEMNDAINELAKDILSSKCAKAAKKAWGESTVAYYSNSESTSTKLSNLLDQEQSLILKYNTDSTATYTTSINGKSYSLSDLLLSRDLTIDQIITGYEQILKRENRALGNIYLWLVEARQEIAAEYGYDNYSDYCYQVVYGRDYSTSDIEEFCTQVKTYIVPLFEEFTENYDYEASDVLDEKFATLSSDDLCSLMEPYLSKISSNLSSSFEYMTTNHLYNIDSSESKMSGAFTIFLGKYSEPFLYSQPNNCFYDMMSLVHEFGHFNGYLTNYTENSYDNLDIAEIESQGLELLYTKFYTKMLGNDDGDAAIEYTLYQKLAAIIEGCLFDEFQQEVYALESPTLDQINSIYTKLCKEYGLVESDYTGTCYGWTSIPHNYSSPLYYISYAVSVSPAFEIWEDSLTDWSSACKEYNTLVNLGVSGSYLDTLEACGLSSPFSDGYFEKLATTLETYLGYNESEEQAE